MELSKHMLTVVEAENTRIRREIITAVFEAFKRAGFRVTVSHDSENTTEQTVGDVFSCIKAVEEDEHDLSRCWLFAYGQKVENKAPLWVLLEMDNVEDVVSDYHVGAEKFMAQANEIANRYM